MVADAEVTVGSRVTVKGVMPGDAGHRYTLGVSGAVFIIGRMWDRSDSRERQDQEIELARNADMKCSLGSRRFSKSKYARKMSAADERPVRCIIHIVYIDLT